MADVNDIELWREVPDFPNYRVSNLGRVTSAMHPSRLLAQTLNRSGYAYCSVQHGGRETKRSRWVHRMVMAAFVGPANGMEVNHKNGIKTDNRLENLEYVTPKENTRHAFENGLRSGAIITESMSQEVAALHGVMSQKEIAKRFGVSLSTITRINRRQRSKSESVYF